MLKSALTYEPQGVVGWFLEPTPIRSPISLQVFLEFLRPVPRWSSGPELKPRFTGVARNGQQSRLQVDSSGKLWSPLSIPFTPRVVSSSTLYRVPTSSHALIFLSSVFHYPLFCPSSFAFPAHFQSPFKIFFTSIFPLSR